MSIEHEGAVAPTPDPNSMSRARVTRPQARICTRGWIVQGVL